MLLRIHGAGAGSELAMKAYGTYAIRARPWTKEFLIELINSGDAMVMENEGTSYSVIGELARLGMPAIIEAATGFGFKEAPSVRVTNIEWIDYLWYAVMMRDKMVDTGSDIMDVIAATPNEALQEILVSNGYTGNVDRASMTLAVLFGRWIHHPLYQAKTYDRQVVLGLDAYDPFNVWAAGDMLSATLYKHRFPPGSVVAMALRLHQYDSVRRNIDMVLNMTPEAAALANAKYEVVLPTGANPSTYLIEKMRDYLPVIDTIEDGRVLPPLLDPPYTTELRLYTDRQLLDRFEVYEPWSSRAHLLSIIRDQIDDGDKEWRLARKHCRNLDKINIIEGEPRGQLDMHDEADPVLSYGTLVHYDCYFVSELMASFREDAEQGFRFINPDASGTQNDFTRASISNLAELLEKLVLKGGPSKAVYKLLLDKVRHGQELGNIDARMMAKMTAKVQAMTAEQRQALNGYLVRLFLMGMTGRFWKGPGHEWPHDWIEPRRAEHNLIRCTAIERESRIQAEKMLLDTIRQGLGPIGISGGKPMENDPTATVPFLDWVLWLPVISYKWKDGKLAIGRAGKDAPDDPNAPAANANTLWYYVELAITRQAYCLGDLSNKLTETAYAYLINFNGWDDAALNVYLRQVLERPDQPDFISTEMNSSGHVDPQAEQPEFEFD